MTATNSSCAHTSFPIRRQLDLPFQLLAGTAMNDAQRVHSAPLRRPLKK
jgi:hypothetical protein